MPHSPGKNLTNYLHLRAASQGGRGGETGQTSGIPIISVGTEKRTHPFNREGSRSRPPCGSIPLEVRGGARARGRSGTHLIPSGPLYSAYVGSRSLSHTVSGRTPYGPRMVRKIPNACALGGGRKCRSACGSPRHRRYKVI